MLIEWTATAEEDALAIADYILVLDSMNAFAQYGAIRDQIGCLAKHPRLGRPGRINGTRELDISGTPYCAAYRMERGAVVILRVLHGGQCRPEAL